MKYYSQYNQDEFVYNSFFKNVKEGVFLEIGADDGERFSNCKFFEEHLNWTGIAIEARKVAYEKLIKNRNCICIHCVLSDKEEETDFLELRGYGLGLSGLINKYDERHKERIKKNCKMAAHKGKSIIKVSTKKLSDILEKHKMENIDFLSIDTEGSELDILSTLDFDKYNINVITIEDNYNDPKLMSFFIERGYEFVKKIKCDKIFKKIK